MVKNERKKRIPFVERYGYELKDETGTQKFKRLSELRLKHFSKVGKGLVTMGQKYKYTSEQKAYVQNFVVDLCQKINDSFETQVEDETTIEVPE